MTFVKYLGVQILAYGFDMGGFLLILNFDLSGPLEANIFAKMVAACVAFIMHRSFTFGVSGRSAATKQAMRYFFVLGINVPMASAILSLILLWLPQPVIAKLLSDIICVGVTYALSKYFIFKVQFPVRDGGRKI